MGASGVPYNMGILIASPTVSGIILHIIRELRRGKEEMLDSKDLGEICRSLKVGDNEVVIGLGWVLESNHGLNQLLVHIDCDQVSYIPVLFSEDASSIRVPLFPDPGQVFEVILTSIRSHAREDWRYIFPLNCLLLLSGSSKTSLGLQHFSRLLA
ncbi:hypothetical protein GOBAR_DD20184 [Gossypium barbadense]|nr:hypothetical protein GOBAR_DD20184 [Gossypium barbadense]